MGLHTYEQSFKDVENSLRCLNARGVVITHDCNPQSEAMARPLRLMGYAPGSNQQDWGVEWNGDVWKTICRLRSTHDDLNIFVLDCDKGMGIITRGKPEGLLYGFFNRSRENQRNQED